MEKKRTTEDEEDGEDKWVVRRSKEAGRKEKVKNENNRVSRTKSVPVCSRKRF